MQIQWPLVLFTLFAGMGAGCFAFVAICELAGKAEPMRRKGAWAALAALIIGGVASVFHLSYPLRAIRVLGHLGTPLGLELTFLALTVLAILAYLLIPGAGARKVTAGCGLALGTILAFVMGYSYVLPARPGWNTMLLPLSYVASAAVLGLFAGLVLLAWADKGDADALRVTTHAALAAVAAQALVIFLYGANVLQVAGTGVLGGAGALVFWLVVVGVGLLIPFLLTLRDQFVAKRPLGLGALGMICVLAGGVAGRALMYVLGHIYTLPL